ncbi:MAG: hypothetical protein EA411_11965 [Saprospirales bacterium]|nr:MAG: hypothetical protein EA411_11965 [Saprospirales bacterium]
MGSTYLAKIRVGSICKVRNSDSLCGLDVIAFIGSGFPIEIPEFFRAMKSGRIKEHKPVIRQTVVSIW